MIPIHSLLSGVSFGLWLLAILLSFAGRAAGQATTVDLLKNDSTNSFSMTVKVVDAVSSKPLANAVVLLPSLAPPPGAQPTNEWRFLTDSGGMAKVRVPGRVVAFNYFSLAVSNRGYPMKSADWNAQSGSVRGAIPGEYTFRLERGGTIGGVVRDERGQPMEGVKVIPWGNGTGAYQFDSAITKAREYSALARDDKAGIVTDAKGFWVFTNHPPDITSLNIDVVRPDGSRSVFVTPGVARQYQMEIGEEVALEALRATNAVLVIKDGVTIRGIVVDKAGKPVPNAVVKERAGSAWNIPVQLVTNDAQGRFALPHRTGSQYLLTAEAQGYAINSTIATVSPDMGEVKLELSPARPVRLRLLSEKDEPVSGADISVPEYRNRGHLLAWKGITDAEGRVTWTNAPLQALSFQITPTNYPMRMARLEPTATEQIVQLRKEPKTSITVHLRVLEEGSGNPVAKFAVWRDLEPHTGFKESNWSGTNGEFTAELATQDFREGRAFAFRVQVRSEGFLPWSGEMAYFDEGDFAATVTLKKATQPVGIVVLPDGRPASNARVMLIAGQGSVFMNSPENQYPGNGVITLKSGADGSFKFDGAEDEQRIVVIHQGGFASVTVEELRRTGKITLQAWARIEGTLRVGGKPVGKERISVRSPVSWVSLDSHHLVFSATTDANGRFIFTNLPPGSYVLYRMPHIVMGMATTESHRLLLDLTAGELKKVDYGFGGRTIVGRIEAGGEVDWKNDPHLISVKLPPAPSTPSYYAYADPKEFEKARRAHGKSKAVLDYERKRQQFQLVFDKDGNFKVDDVPPGTYELNIRATKPNKSSGRYGYQRTEEVLGSIKRDITIPPGAADEEFDLGSIEMEVKEGLGAPSAPLDFTVERFDGKAFNLVSLRGRPAVLIFWGTWAPGSLARLENVYAAVTKLEGNSRPALVAVNLDSDFEEARKSVKGLGSEWIHTRLKGSSIYEVTERLNVDTLPLVLLLDGQGRVMGRDLDGKRLASSVKRLVATKN